MEIRRIPVLGAYKALCRVIRAEVSGSDISMVPIPVVNTIKLPTPVIVHGFISVSSRKSDQTQEM